MKPNRFRFRAWNKKNKEMVFPCPSPQDRSDLAALVSLPDGRVGYCYTGKDGGWDGSASFYEDHVLLQSTGCADKNGVEIFEGDIVVVKLWRNDLGYFKRYKRTVVWNHGGFEYDSPAFTVNCTLRNTVGDCEVVGNIYEQKKG